MHDTTSGPPGPANPFRHYAEATYARPGVSRLLLQLQDQYGLNINLLLLLLWLGQRHIVVNAARLQELRQLLAPGEQEILLPLRRLRRQVRLQQLPERLYQQAKDLELALEFWQIDLLHEHCRGFSPSAAATFPARTNLMLYASATDTAAVPVLEQLLALAGTPA